METTEQTMHLTPPTLAAGETYIGAITTPGEYGSYHLILMPGQINEADWQTAGNWASSQGGELPNRVESALLFATLKAEFDKEAYWTRDEHAAVASYAWFQFFCNGCQYGYLKGIELRARAIRRLPI